jgi:hypothetical protein
VPVCELSEKQNPQAYSGVNSVSFIESELG